MKLNLINTFNNFKSNIKRRINFQLTFKEWLSQYPQKFDIEKLEFDQYSIIDMKGIEKFTKLKYFNGDYNRIWFVPDLSKLQDLEEFDLHSNNIGMVEKIDKNSKLKKVDLSYNNLKRLPNFPKNIEEINIEYNNLFELPDLYNHHELKVLKCEFNRLPYKDLEGYRKWYETEYKPEIGKAKKYNI